MKKTSSMKRRIAAGVLCAALGIATVLSGAEGSQAKRIMGTVSDVQGSVKAKKKILKEAEALPAKFDLRDVNGKNYVTQVKYQNPWGTCWGFAVIAACEESILYENGISDEEFAQLNGGPLDLSEKALSWYTVHGITKEDVKEGVVPASQVGEGVDVSLLEENNINASYDTGGYTFYGSGVLSSGMGPKLENYRFEGEDNEYPYAYRGKNGWTNYDMFRISEVTRGLLYDFYYNYYRPSYPNMSEEEYAEYFKNTIFPLLEERATKAGTGDGSVYSGADDWTMPVDYKHRFSGNVAMLQESVMLPDTYTYKNGEYVYDPIGVAAIKKELVNGRAVCVSFAASHSRPGRIDESKNYLSDKWAQYTYRKDVANHVVTVVGYDDNYSRSNFLQGTDPETGADMTPPGDGAFIVKNSWGSVNDKTEGKHNYGDWGVDGSGYFYLSYYDKSLSEAESFNFYTQKEINETNSSSFNVDQYDFMPVSTVFAIYDTKKSCMANVFKASADQKLNRISVATGMYNSKATYEIYKLKKGYKNPKDGTLLEKGTRDFEFGGFHTIELKGQYPMAAGTEYAVVLTNRVELSSEDGTDTYYEIAANESKTEDGDDFYVYSVVNRGESMLYRDGSWLDWADVSDVSEEVLHSVNGTEYSLDNFSIKAYSVPATKDEIRTKNTIKLNGKSIMKAGTYTVKKAAKNIAFKITRNGTGKITMKNKSSKKLAKYLSLKSGKVVLKKNAPAGKYRFTLTVAAKGEWSKTTSGVVTIVVK